MMEMNAEITSLREEVRLLKTEKADLNRQFVAEMSKKDAEIERQTAEKKNILDLVAQFKIERDGLFVQKEQLQQELRSVHESKQVTHRVPVGMRTQLLRRRRWRTR
jgi:hypothetical protein